MKKNLFLLSGIILCVVIPMNGQSVGLPDDLVTEKLSKIDFSLVTEGNQAEILVDADDSRTVLIAAGLFVDDVARVTGRKLALKTERKDLAPYSVIAGTIDKNQIIKELITSKKIEVAGILNLWESCLIQVLDDPLPGVKKALVIAGSDRRGAAYGILELSKQIGVSPWYYFADVSPRKRERIVIKAGRYIEKSPSVRYRGIFINDEMWGLRPWAMNTLAPHEGQGIGPTTYRKIFELMLRLKANTLWPAMHIGTIPFNTYAENRVLADEYAIVMGSSHIEPMLRNNIEGAEWDQEYPGEPWDYTRNKEHIYKYWEDRIKSNGRYENLYTLGKRGQDDEAGNEITVSVLEQIFTDQRTILSDWINKDVTQIPQVLIPYTEVLGLYNEGLDVPDDVTICWPDDNFGNIRQLPNTREQQRAGGSGVYYHFQWLNGATTAYPWLYTTPLGLTWTEMKKAFDYNVKRLWIVNVGDIKPAEIGIEFFMQMAWDITDFEENNPRKFLLQWASRDFGMAYAAQIADILEKHFELGYARRPEHMMMFSRQDFKWDWFTLYHYNDEAQRRVDAYDALIQQVDDLYASLPVPLKDAFFQMVLYNVKCAALQNKKIIYAHKSAAYGSENRASAGDYARMAREAENEINEIINHFNTGLVTVGSKWNHMASLPGPWGAQWHQWDMPPLSEFNGSGPAELKIALEGGEDDTLPGFSVFNQDKRFIDLFNTGIGAIKWTASASENWIKLSENAGEFEHEARIWVSIEWDRVPKGQLRKGVLTVSGAGNAFQAEVPVFNPAIPSPKMVKGFVESHGYVSMEAEHFSRKFDRGGTGWRIIEGLGRTGNSVTVLPPRIPSQTKISDILNHSPLLEYDVYLFTADSISLTLNCIPTKPINSEYGLRLAVAFDDESPQVVSFQKGDSSIIDNLMTLHSQHRIVSEGQHVLKIWMVDPGVVLDKLVLDTGGIKDSYLGPPESYANQIHPGSASQK